MYTHKTLNPPPSPSSSEEQGATNLFPGFVVTEQSYMEKLSGDRTPHSQSGIIVSERLANCSSHPSLDDYKPNNNIIGRSEKCFKENISRDFSGNVNFWKNSLPISISLSDIWTLPRYSLSEFEDVLEDPLLKCPMKDISFHDSFYWSYDDNDIPGSVINWTWADYDDDDEWSFWRLYDLHDYKDILEDARLFPWLYKDMSGTFVLIDECTYRQHINMRIHGPCTIYDLCPNHYDVDVSYMDIDSNYLNNESLQHYYYAQVDEYPSIRELPDYLHNFFSKFFKTMIDVMNICTPEEWDFHSWLFGDIVPHLMVRDGIEMEGARNTLTALGYMSPDLSSIFDGWRDFLDVHTKYKKGTIDKFFGTIERVVFATISIISNPSTIGNVATCLLFISAEFSSSGISGEIYKLLHESAVEVNGLVSNAGEYGLHSQGFMDNLRDVLFCGQQLQNSSLGKHVKRVVNLLSLLVMCSASKIDINSMDLKGIMVAMQDTLKTDSYIGVINSILETFVYFVERGSEFCRTWDFRCLSETPTSLREFEKQFSQICQIHPQAMNGNLDRMKFGIHQFSDGDVDVDHHSYMGLLDSTLKLGRRALEDCKSNREWKSYLATSLIKVQQYFNDFHVLRANSACRIRPFSIILSGDSGVGKSTFHSTLMNYILEHNGFGHRVEQIISVNSADKFMDTAKGYTTGVILDEIANQKAETLVGGISPCQMILNVINNQPYLPNKSDVKEKAMTCLEPMVVIGTTNKPDLEAFYWSNNPSSITNRWEMHVRMEVKPEYEVKHVAHDGSVIQLPNLDTSAIPEKSGDIHDLWNFKLYHFVPTCESKGINKQPGFHYRNRAGEKVFIDRTLSAKELVELALEVSEMHFERQRKIVASTNSFNDSVRKCKTCSKVGDFCICKGVDGKMSQEIQAEGLVAHSNLFFKYNSTNIFNMMSRRMWLVPLIPYMGLNMSGSKLTFLYCYRKEMFRPTPLGYLVVIFYAWIASILVWCGEYPLLNCWLVYGVYTYVKMLACQFYFLHNVLGSKVYSTSSFRQLMNNRRFQKMLAASGFVSILYLLSRTFRKFPNVVAQGGLNPSSVQDIFDRDTQKNVWNNVRMSPRMDVDKDMVDNASMTTYVKAHCLRYIEMDGSRPDTRKGCNVFLLDKSYVIIPAHMWDRTSVINATIRYATKTFTDTYNVKLYPRFAHVIEQNGKPIDLLLVHVPSLRSSRNSIPLFPNEYPRSDTYVSFLSTTREDEYFECNAVQARMHEVSPTVMCPDGILRSDLGINAEYELDKITYTGLCIGTLITLGKPPCILGFHLAGDGFKGRASLLTRHDLEKAVSALSVVVNGVSLEAHSGTNIPEEVHGLPILKTGEIKRRHPLNYMVKPGAVEVFGNTGVSVREETSNVIVSPISPYITELLGVQNRWGPPPFKGLDNRSSWKKWQQAFSYMVDPCMSFDPDLLNRATSDYLRPLLDRIDKGLYDMRYSRPLTEREVVNGIRGVRFIDRMNMQTSMGFPLGGPKNAFLVDHTDEKGEKYQLFHDDFHKAARDAESFILTGRRVNFIHKACVKDEVVEQGKEKVRIFEAAPLTEQLLVRKYGLPIARFLSNNCLLSECAVGINCYGKEWDELCEHITQFGNDKILAGDYSKYDLRMSSQLILQAFKVMLIIAEKMGYTKDQLFIFQGLATEIANPLITIDGVLSLFSGCNPSGHNLTVYINSIVNSLLLRMTFFTLYPDLIDFRKYCSAMTYGDDVFAGVSDLTLGFSILSHSSFMGAHGIVFTLPDKSLELVDHLPLAKTDFLKRNPVFRTELGRWQAPIEYDSIMKSLHCLVKSSSVGVAEQSMQCMNSALRELFLHGREAYEKHREVFNGIMSHLSWKPFSGSIFHVAYEDFLRLWLDDLEDDFQLDGEPSAFVSQTGEYGYHRTESQSVRKAFYLSNGENMMEKCYKVPWRRPDLPSHMNLLIPNYINNNDYEASGSPQFLEKVRVADTREKLLGMDVPHYIAQSEERIHLEACDTHTQEGLLQFSDANPGMCLVPDMADINASVPIDDNLSLSRYLNRPVFIDTETWTLGGTAVSVINPWNLFLTNKQVANRINNFRGIKGNLHVRFVVNGNGYYSGKWVCAYNPLHGYDQIFSSSASYPTAWTYHTQKNHIILDAGSSSSATMICPFIWHSDYLDITTAEKESIGSLILGPLTPLAHANGSTAGLTISIFAWMEDVELVYPTSVPISGLTAQSDEYSKTRVSGIASVVARSMGMLSNLPVIGPFALASSIVIGKLGQVAELFGYSKPRQIADIQRVQPIIVGDLCTVDGKDTSVSLAVDSKQEISIDPRIGGFGTVDEMMLSTLIAKRTYLTSFNWSGSQSPSTLLWNAYVTPRLIPSLTSTPATGVLNYQTPLSALARLFGSWRGDIEFTIQVVACSLFKGRLLVTWDPIYDASNRTTTHLQYSHIIDIAEETEVTLKIGWGSIFPWLDTGRIIDVGSGHGNVAITTILRQLTNGVVTFSVLNNLTGISATVPNATINVWVNGASNFEFANPRGDESYNDACQVTPFSQLQPTLGNLSAYGDRYEVLNSQSAEYEVGYSRNPALSMYDPKIKVITMGKSSSKNDNSAAMNFGEDIRSLRQLIKRYNFHRSVDFILSETLTSPVRLVPSATSRVYMFQLVRRNLPYFNGNVPGFGYTYKRTTTQLQSTYVREHLINFLLPAYVAYRGSTRFKYYHIAATGSAGAGTSLYMSTTRIPSGASLSTNSFAHEYRVVNSFDTDYLAMCKGAGSLQSGAGMLRYRGLDAYSGGIIRPGTQSNVIEIELPYQTKYKFTPARRTDLLGANPGLLDRENVGGLIVRGITSYPGGTKGVMSLEEYVAAGDDFSLFGFTGFPPVYPVNDVISSV